MTESSVSNLINALGKNDQKAKPAMNELQNMGMTVIPELIDALGNRTGLKALLDPIYRLFDQPEKISKSQAKNVRSQRIEKILTDLAPGSIPQLVSELGHPNIDTRRSLARVLANIGQPAVSELTNLMRSELPGSRSWNAADAALCAILDMPTRREIKSRQEHIISAWIAGGLIFVLFAWLFFTVGLELVWSAVIGLIAGYIMWSMIIHDSSTFTYEGIDGIIFFIVDTLSAPFVYRKKAKEFATKSAKREQTMNQYGLPE